MTKETITKNRVYSLDAKYYNNERYYKLLDNVTPADVYYGRHQEIITGREQLKQQTLKARRWYN